MTVQNKENMMPYRFFDHIPNCDSRGMTTEYGRSMTEMLGILVIIGVLSIGGITGYSYAMDKYRANITMNDVNLRAVDLIAQASHGENLSLAEWPAKIAGKYDIGLEVDPSTNTTNGGIYVSTVPNRVCEIIGENLLQANVNLVIDGDKYTKGKCGEINKLVFYYDAIKTASKKTPEPCNGPTVDGKCEPCETGSVWNETKEQCLCPNGCPTNTPFNSPNYNICTTCPSNAVSTGCGCDIGCPENYWLFDNTDLNGTIQCYPCPEGATSPGGKTQECTCSSGTFQGCWDGTAQCTTRVTPCPAPF